MTQPEYDDLWPGGPRFVRSGAGFALGTDSVLLADFAAQRRARRIADLGCGAGVLTVLLLRALEQAPPALAADVYDNGLLMAGGGALLRGLDQCIARATHLKVAVDKDPLTTVLRGTAQAMLYREDYEGIFIN